MVFSITRVPKASSGLSISVARYGESITEYNLSQMGIYSRRCMHCDADLLRDVCVGWESQAVRCMCSQSLPRRGTMHTLACHSICKDVAVTRSMVRHSSVQEMLLMETA